MQRIFDNLSNIGLRRLFKFAVKRALGRYLENELLIEQLSVQTRDGVMSLSDIKFNCDLINKEVFEVMPLPFRLVRCSVDVLEAKVSYSSLLAEGFQFNLRGVHILIESNPQVSQAGKVSNQNLEHGSRPIQTAKTQESSTSSATNADVDDGMAFIANWLDALVAGLKITVEDVDIVIRTHIDPDRTTNHSSRKHRRYKYEAGLSIKIDSVSLFNSVVGGYGSETSVMLSERMVSEHTPSVATRKVLKCSFIRASVYKRKIFHDQSWSSSFELEPQEIFTIDAGSSFSFETNPPSATTSTSCIDANISQIHANVDVETLELLLLIAKTMMLSPGERSSNADMRFGSKFSSLNTLAWLEENIGHQKDGEIDYAKVLQHLKQNRLQATLSPPVQLNRKVPHEHHHVRHHDEVESDGEFPDSDGEYDESLEESAADLSESQFHEAKTTSRSVGWSRSVPTRRKGPGGDALNASTYGGATGSVLYYSTYEGADDEFVGQTRPTLLPTVRYSVKACLAGVELEFADSSLGTADRTALQLHLSGCTVDFQAQDYNDAGTTGLALEHINVSVAGFEIQEVGVGWADSEPQTRCLLAFDSRLCPGEISMGPAIDVAVTADRLDVIAKQMLNISVNLRPLLISIHNDCVNHWTEVLSSVPFGPTGDSSTVQFKMSCKTGAADLILHTYTTHPKQRWTELSNALDLSNTKVACPWSRIATAVSGGDDGLGRLEEMLGQSRGGIRVSFKDAEMVSESVEIGGQVNTAQKFTRICDVKRVTGSIFFFNPNGNLGMETVFIDALKSDSADSAISLESTTMNASMKSVNSGVEAEISPSRVAGGFVLYVRADKVSVDICQREYNALVSICSFFSPPRDDVELESIICFKYTSSLSKQKILSGAVDNPVSKPGFGVVLSANSATIRVTSSDDFTCVQGFHRHATAENDIEFLLRQTFPTKSFPSASTGRSTLGSSLADPYIFSLAARGMVMEMFGLRNETYFAASALDISLYETEVSMLASGIDSIPIIHRSSLSHNICSHVDGPVGDLTTARTQSPRDNWVIVDNCCDEELDENLKSHAAGVGRVVYVDPRALSFILRDGAYVQTEASDPRLLPSVASNTSILHAVSLQVRFLEVPLSESLQTSKQDIQIHLDLRNVTYNFDPSSNWISIVPVLLTPLRPIDILCRRQKIRAQANRLLMLSQSQMGGSVYGSAYAPSAPVEEDTLAGSEAPFAVTAVTVNVSQCLIDYRCPEQTSRILLSIGHLNIMCTIVSTSPLFSVKVTAEEIDLFVSKYLNIRRELEQCPLTIDAHIREPAPIVDQHAIDSLLRNEFDIHRSTENSNTKKTGTFIQSASEFLDLHLFVPLIALSKSSLFVTLNTKFGSASKDPYLQRSHSTLNATNSPLLQKPLVEWYDAEDEALSGFASTSVAMSMHGCHIEARMDSIDIIVASANTCNTELTNALASLRRPDYEFEPYVEKEGSPIGADASMMMLQASRTWLNQVDDNLFAPMSASQFNSFALNRIVHNPSLLNQTREIDSNRMRTGTDEDAASETQGRWLPVFDYDAESEFAEAEDDDGFQPNDEALEEESIAAPAQMHKGLNDSAPKTDINEGGIVDEPDDEEEVDVRFKPEFEFQEDEYDNDDDDTGNVVDTLNLRGESIYGLAAFSTMMYNRFKGEKAPEDVELTVLADNGDGDDVDQLVAHDASQGLAQGEVEVEDLESDDDEGEETVVAFADSDSIQDAMKAKVASPPQMQMSAGIVIPHRKVGIVAPHDNTRGVRWQGGGGGGRGIRPPSPETEPSSPEETARWLVNAEEIVIREHYVPSRVVEKSDIPTRELQLRPRFLFQLEANVHFKILGGFDWPSDELLLAKVIKHEDEADLAESEFPGYSDKDGITSGATGRPASKGATRGPVDKLNSERQRLLLAALTSEDENEDVASLGATSSAAGGRNSSLFDAKSQARRQDSTSSRQHAAAPKVPSMTAPRRNVDVKRFSRDNEDCMGAHIKGLTIKLRIYDQEVNSLQEQRRNIILHDTEVEDVSVGQSQEQELLTEGNKGDLPIPDLRMSASVSDAVVWLAWQGRRKRKVLGRNKESSGSRGLGVGGLDGVGAHHQPFISITSTGYDVSSTAVHTKQGQPKKQHTADMEYRVAVSLLPVRVFLNESVLQFVKALGECQECIDIVAEGRGGTGNSNRGSESSSELSVDSHGDVHPPAVAPSSRSSLYIQYIGIAAIDVVIDYEPSMLNIDKLQEGDYLQLLNFFPLEKMNITLSAFKMTGVSSFTKLFAAAGEFWVRDIYDHQMYRVLSGAAPLKALSNIGAGLHDFLLMPLEEYNRARQKQQQLQRQQRGSGAAGGAGAGGGGAAMQTGHVTRVLKKTTMKLFQTVSRETLDVSHKLTMFLARGIESLASGTEVPQPTSLPAPLPQSQRTSSRDGPHAMSSLGIAAADARQQNRPLKQRTTQLSTGVSRGRKIGDEWESQPRGLKEGLRRGMDSLSRELSSAAEVLVTLPLRAYRRSGSRGQYVREVITALPVALLRPVAGAAEAMSYTLLGLRNDVDPSARVGEEDLWEHSLSESIVLRRSPTTSSSSSSSSSAAQKGQNNRKTNS